MSRKALIRELESVRTDFLDSLESLKALSSFEFLFDYSKSFKSTIEAIEKDISDRVSAPVDSRFYVAIVGSSGHGKTTICDELFPDLSERGWLETDITDTTSQAMQISYCPADDPAKEEVAISSWSVRRLRKLFDDEKVSRLNKADNITTDYETKHIRVVANDGSFFVGDGEYQPRFPVEIELIPFASKHSISEEYRSDPDFIRFLTTKMPSEEVDPEYNIHIEDKPYNALQLRALISRITLNDPFHNIRSWLESCRQDFPEFELEDLVFVDTPGIGVASNAKDEVLRHALGQKSNQLIVDLLVEDELDAMIHLVLCTRKSGLATIWESLDRQADVSDLEERTILAVNGTNEFFENKDLKRKSQHCKHVESAVGDNILNVMKPRGSTFKPYDVCFIDSLKFLGGVVENTEKAMQAGINRYVHRYQQDYREELENWHHCEVLRKYCDIELFQQNAAALMDPDDRGQGHLIRRIVHMMETTGLPHLVKKNLLRSGLYNLLRRLDDLLEITYEADGAIRQQAANSSLNAVFEPLGEDLHQGIEAFCSQHIDQPNTDNSITFKPLHTIIHLAEQAQDKDGWAAAAFVSMVEYLAERLIETSGVQSEVAEVAKNYMMENAAEWKKAWGYTSASIPLSRKEILIHVLGNHSREVLFQVTSDIHNAENQLYTQAEDDRQSIIDIIANLRSALAKSEKIAHQQGVTLI